MLILRNWKVYVVFTWLTKIENQKLHVAILTDIRKLGIEAKRRQYEIPPVIIIDFETFTPGGFAALYKSWPLENGRVTPSLKICRHKIAQYYKERILKLYKEISNLKLNLQFVDTNSNQMEVSSFSILYNWDRRTNLQFRTLRVSWCKSRTWMFLIWKMWLFRRLAEILYQQFGSNIYLSSYSLAD